MNKANYELLASFQFENTKKITLKKFLLIFQKLLHPNFVGPTKLPLQLPP